MQNREEEWLLQEKFGGEKSEVFFAACHRLTKSEPLAYLIGWVPFLHCKIYLDSKPLIPRPETEYWTEAVIATITTQTKLPIEHDASRKIHVLDLCAGSGCIGVAMASTLPHTTVDFAEIETTHLSTIQKNILENGINPTRTTIIHSNLFSTITKRYDFILSNPPYIDATLDRTETAVKAHEPSLALYGGRQGLEIISQIIVEAPAHLAQRGQLWIEHEPEQSVAIQELGTRNGFTVSTHKDQYAVERYSILVLQ